MFENLNKKLGFGCMRFPLDAQGAIDYATTTKMIDSFLEQGFTYFDTAYPYHDGQSEIAVRECLVKRHPRESFLLADKMPTWIIEDSAQYQKIFDEQLEKCGVSYFDFYLLHNIGGRFYDIALRTGGFDFLRKLKETGKAKHIGFSYHDNPELLDEVLTKYPEVEFVQLQINYTDWDNPGIQAGACYEVACKHNVPIIVMEPVKGGGLANLTPDARAHFDALGNASNASYAIRFAASLDNVAVVLSGMSNMEQLTDNTSFMADFVPLNDAEKDAIAKVAEILKTQKVIPCTSCRYCVVECPQEILIPDLFGLYNSTVQFKTNPQVSLYERKTKNIGHGSAGDCIECGACEAHCPQHLEIRDYLKKVKEIFTY